MSSTYRPNSITLYLRPIANIQPYQIYNCAIWLVLTKRFKCVQSARKWLLELEMYKIWEFKAIMSAYFEYMERSAQFSIYDVNTYRSSPIPTYGEDPNMYWHTDLPH